MQCIIKFPKLQVWRIEKRLLIITITVCSILHYSCGSIKPSNKQMYNMFYEEAKNEFLARCMFYTDTVYKGTGCSRMLLHTITRQEFLLLDSISRSIHNNLKLELKNSLESDGLPSHMTVPSNTCITHACMQACQNHPQVEKIAKDFATRSLKTYLKYQKK